jgi:hypothetical protein
LGQNLPCDVRAFQLQKLVQVVQGGKGEVDRGEPGVIQRMIERKEGSSILLVVSPLSF